MVLEKSEILNRFKGHLPSFTFAFHSDVHYLLRNLQVGMIKRRSSTRLSKQKKKLKQPGNQRNTAAQLCFIMELDASSVSDYLSTADISALFEACPGVFSQGFVDILTLEGVNWFATENKTHVGRRCACDWMRRLDGFLYDTKCGEKPFNVNMSMPIFQTPIGTRALFNALGLAERLLKPFRVEDGRGQAMFAPVVCLLTEGDKSLFTKLDVKKAMNLVCDGAGTRFFYKFNTKSTKRRYSRADFIDDHWGDIEGSSCRQCDKLPSYRAEPNRGHSRIKWKDNNIESIRANCRAVYQPLKAAMEKELQFVRYIPMPHKSGSGVKCNGLVAGVSTSGVFCGMYVVNGYWPYNRRGRQSKQ